MSELRSLIKDRVRYTLCVIAAVLFALPLVAVTLPVQEAVRPEPGPLQNPRRVASQAAEIEYLVQRAWPDVRDVQTMRVKTEHESSVIAIFGERRAKFRLLDNGTVLPDNDEAREIYRRLSPPPRE